MQQNFKIQLPFILTAIILFNGCSPKLEYIEYSNTLHKKIKWTTWDEYKEYQRATKNIKLNGYFIEFYRVEPHLKITGKYMNKRISLRQESSWAEGWGFTPRAKYTEPYTFMMFTLNQEPFNKNMLSYFNTLNQTYETKLNSKDINKFVKYDCDKNIVFSKYERDENYKPLEATCYAKRLDKDVFLITRFAHPNTKDDRVLFNNEIIPTMLKSIKITPTKLSPWKYY